MMVEGHAIPTRLGQLQMLALLGQGAMGQVYLAQERDSGQRVAVKLLVPRLASSPKLVARFAAEARLLTRVSHPNVVQVLDFGAMPDGTLYLVMEWLDGVGLDELLRRRGWFTVAETLCYARQICAALQAVHDQGVIHRDLKPENVLVLHSHPLTLKVVDFGVAKLINPSSSEVDLTTVGELVGTPMNMAPEQIEGRRREIGPWTDVYALGLLLYTMLAGSHPYAGVNLEAAIFRNLLDPPQPLFRVTPDVPEEVSDVVQCCLEKDPVQRYPSVTELLAALTAAVEAASPLHLTDETVQDTAPLHLADATEETEETDLDPDQRQTAVYPPAGPARVQDTVPDAARPHLPGSDGVVFRAEVNAPGAGEITVSGEIVSPGLEFEVAEQLPPPSHGEPPSLQQVPTPVVVKRTSRSGVLWLLLGVGLLVVAVGLFLVLAFL